MCYNGRWRMAPTGVRARAVRRRSVGTSLCCSGWGPTAASGARAYALRRRKGKLHFVLITTDISANSRDEILRDFAHYPVVQHYRATDLERLFNVRGAKVIGFAKAGLSQSIYAELKMHRINQPMTTQKPPELPPTPPTARKVRPTSPSPQRDRR